jgi:hypothetical protein
MKMPIVETNNQIVCELNSQIINLCPFYYVNIFRLVRVYVALLLRTYCDFPASLVLEDLTIRKLDRWLPHT